MLAGGRRCPLAAGKAEFGYSAAVLPGDLDGSTASPTSLVGAPGYTEHVTATYCADSRSAPQAGRVYIYAGDADPRRPVPHSARSQSPTVHVIRNPFARPDPSSGRADLTRFGHSLAPLADVGQLRRPVGWRAHLPRALPATCQQRARRQARLPRRRRPLLDQGATPLTREPRSWWTARRARDA